MGRSAAVLALLLGGVSLGRATPTLAQKEHPVSWTARGVQPSTPIRPGGQFTLTVAARIPTGWHIYSLTQVAGGPIPMTLSVGPTGTARLAGKVGAPRPIVADDLNFGIKTETYVDSALFRVPIGLASTIGTGSTKVVVVIGYETCNERICLPPTSDTLTATVSVAGAPLSGASSGGAPPVDSSAAPEAAATPASASGGSAIGGGSAIPAEHGNSSESLALFLWLAATMGALSLLTPCVFPMVPITISYFSGRASGDRGRALRDAIVYGCGIVGAFTGLGLGVSLIFGVAGLNRFAANPWLNLAIALLFAGFGLSLFGALDLTLPSGLLTRLDALSRGGSIGRDGTTLLMGGTFAVTSFTCTAPFVGTLLVSATQGNLKWPAIGLLMFSCVFALPFLVLALVPEALSRLPRGGEWMVTLKGTLAFVELAAAMKFLSNADLVAGWGIFTRNVVVASWVALGAGLTCYLLGVRFHTRTAVPTARRPIGALVALGVTAWLVTGLTGRRLGEVESFLPPAGANATGVANGRELSWILDDYAGALAQARAERKLVLIDFTGYTCTNCRWMEANMFPRDTVRGAMERFIRVRLFTDGQGERDRSQSMLQQTTFGTAALPLYAVVDSLGVAHGTFRGMTRSTAEFVDFLTAAADHK